MITLLSRYGKLLGILLILVLVGLALYLFPPQEVVSYIGVENAYLVGFLITLLAGVSSFTGTAAYATVGALAQGGAHPIILGLVGGIGLFLSDTIFYFLITKGIESVKKGKDSFLMRLERLFSKVPTSVVLFIVFVYTGFSPFPNDLLLIALLIGGYKYKTFALPLLAGAITLMLIITHIGLLWA